MFFITIFYHQTEADQQSELAGQLPRVPINGEPALERYLDEEHCSGLSHGRATVFLEPSIHNSD